jgi:hypothetical protein
VRRGGGGGGGDVALCVRYDVRLLWCSDLPFLSPGRVKKRHSFHSGELGAERRCQPPKPVRGAEASTAAVMPRGAAQAGLTEGAERSLKFAWKRMSKERSSRRLHLIVIRAGIAGRN